jgi:hypothetical protein
MLSSNNYKLNKFDFPFSFGVSTPVGKAISCFFCFASVQNCETYPPAWGKNKQALKTKWSLYVVWI